MIHIQFSVYDSAAQAYLPPFILPREEMAKRTFADCCNSESHQFGANPKDYTLFRLGTWCDETARFTPEPNGAFPVGNGVTFVQEVNGHGGPSNGTQAVSNEAPVQPGSPGADSEE